MGSRLEGPGSDADGVMNADIKGRGYESSSSCLTLLTTTDPTVAVIVSPITGALLM